MPRRYRPCVFLVAATLVILVSMAGVQAPAPQAGQASGTLTVEGKAIKLAYAAAFVDQSDSRKPIVLLLTEQQLPAATWTSEFDVIRYRGDKPFKGVGFYLDKKREVFRTEYYADKFPTAVMGVFELTLDPGAGKALVGSARSTGQDPKLDVRFNAPLK